MKHHATKSSHEHFIFIISKFRVVFLSSNNYLGLCFYCYINDMGVFRCIYMLTFFPKSTVTDDWYGSIYTCSLWSVFVWQWFGIGVPAQECCWDRKESKQRFCHVLLIVKIKQYLKVTLLETYPNLPPPSVHKSGDEIFKKWL